ncbi:hypothetical protein LEP1GSC060_2757 [Leptospira weilii serovar Ranarum str. ICFT]|uniref:Uncharacterized protein n=1 Tax=Leptospira weilii serovar Ranarum str. ICFT TaxID=1218598 RepID=N1WQ72_9LEPT|nr:hypothetical protein LEP1GSC060_2757 [Leptospira weilii serovar Ranarum str. ICFT]
MFLKLNPIRLFLGIKTSFLRINVSFLKVRRTNLRNFALFILNNFFY